MDIQYEYDRYLYGTCTVRTGTIEVYGVRIGPVLQVRTRTVVTLQYLYRYCTYLYIVLILAISTMIQYASAVRVSTVELYCNYSINIQYIPARYTRTVRTCTVDY